MPPKNTSDTPAATEAKANIPAGLGDPGQAPVVKSDVAAVPVPGLAPVAGLGEAAAALGAPVIPVPVGGPGVGAAQVAEPAAGVAVTKLPDASTCAPELVAFVDGAIGAGRVRADFRDSMLRLGASSATGLADLRELVGVEATSGQTAATAAAIRTEILGTAGRVTVDPDEVPGTRWFEVLTQVVHDGKHYVPGDDVELTFRSYSELVSIGAVPPIDWKTGHPFERV